MSHTILQEIVLLLMVSVASVVIFRRLNMPPILAYIFVGILVGPHAFGWVPNDESTRFLAEFGVVFLMFTVGLEFSLPQLMAMRKEVFAVGGAQVGITALIIAAVVFALGEPADTAFIIGGIIALSSTAIVIKQLTEQLELNSRHGRLSVAILIFQDLAVIPFLIIIPMISSNTDSSITWELSLAVVKGIAVISIMLAIGHWLLRPLFYEVAKQHSAELFTLTILLFSVAAAWVTHLSGLSLALGAFIAGMMLSETEFKHQVEVDIRPFRDVLLGLFFITIGMLLDIGELPAILPYVLLCVVALVIFKFGIIFLLSRLSGYESGVASRAGIVLAQGGEFGFAIMAIAIANNVLSQETSQIVLSTVVISMLLSPFFIRYNGQITKKLFTKSYLGSRQDNIKSIDEETRELSGHVIICGYGRIGQNIAKFLKMQEFEYVALDLDPVIVKEAHEAGDPVFYADSTHQEILEAVKISKARVIVISYDDYSGSKKIISMVKAVRPDMPILVRTRDDSNLADLQALGATEIVPETLEASLMLSSYLLMTLDVPMRKIVANIREVRAARYQLLHEYFHGQETRTIEDPDAHREGLHSFTVPEGAYCIGKTLQEIEFEKVHVTVTALRHNEVCHERPGAEALIEAGDVLVLYGTPEDFEHAKSVMLSGRD